MSNFRSPALLRHARDQACVNCGAEDGTVVAAHSNRSIHGKGAMLKAHDCFVAHLCARCHGWLDQGGGSDPTGMWTVKEKDEFFARCMDRTLLRLFQQGKLRVTT